jgi:hypothetical protein
MRTLLGNEQSPTEDTGFTIISKFKEDGKTLQELIEEMLRDSLIE